jgi:hypothetical protein
MPGTCQPQLVGKASVKNHQLLPLIKVQDAKRSTTILQQVGYNEVVGVRQAGKSTACIACLFLDNLCTSLVASLLQSTVAGGCFQL